MPDPKPNATTPQPTRGAERSLDTAVEATFPASDPSAATSTQGARAVPVEGMLDGPGGGDAAPGAADRPVRRHFADAEAAKLALESLVREAPLERRCAAIEPAAGGATLVIRSAPDDAARIEALLDRLGAPA